MLACGFLPDTSAEHEGRARQQHGRRRRFRRGGQGRQRLVGQVQLPLAALRQCARSLRALGKAVFHARPVDEIAERRNADLIAAGRQQGKEQAGVVAGLFGGEVGIIVILRQQGAVPP